MSGGRLEVGDGRTENLRIQEELGMVQKQTIWTWLRRKLEFHVIPVVLTADRMSEAGNILSVHGGPSPSRGQCWPSDRPPTKK